MRVLLVLSLFLVFIDGESLRGQFREWQKKWGKDYGNLHDSVSRYQTFKKTVEKVAMLNKMQDEWVAGLTFFADLSEDEKILYTGLNSSQLEKEDTDYGVALGAAFDPTDPAKVYHEMGPGQNQWGCGSCWAFAAVGVLEGLYIKHQSEYKGFSEQTLLDCTFEGTRDGCDGGFSDTAINWVGRTGPLSWGKSGYLPSRTQNPYLSSDNACSDPQKKYWNLFRKAKVYASYNRQRNDAGLQHALATEGPVVVYIYSSWALPLYISGTFQGVGCGWDPKVNHAVVATGYEKGWWLIRNSWGSSWGYSGSFYLSRSWENLCSVSKWIFKVTWTYTRWDHCTEVDPEHRTPCVDDQVLGQAECEAKGCCYDSSFQGSKEQCFAKGEAAIYDSAGHKRVFYGSVADFTVHAFTDTAAKVEVKSGTWVVYTKPIWRGDGLVVKSSSGSISKRIQSLRLITTKDTITLFTDYQFSGNKLTLSKNIEKLERQFDNVISSTISPDKWSGCTDPNYGGNCEIYEGENARVTNNDVLSSVKKN